MIPMSTGNETGRLFIVSSLRSAPSHDRAKGILLSSLIPPETAAGCIAFGLNPFIGPNDSPSSSPVR